MLNDDFSDMLSAFFAEGVEFLVVEAYALAAHGFPRATGDLDCWVRPTADNAERVLRAIDRFGAPRHGLTAEELQRPGLIYQVGVAPVRIDILTSIDGVAFEEAHARRSVVSVDGLDLPVRGRDDLITNTLASGRPQDVADVKRLQADPRRHTS